MVKLIISKSLTAIDDELKHMRGPFLSIVAFIKIRHCPLFTELFKGVLQPRKEEVCMGAHSLTIILYFTGPTAHLRLWPAQFRRVQRFFAPVRGRQVFPHKGYIFTETAILRGFMSSAVDFDAHGAHVTAEWSRAHRSEKFETQLNSILA